VDLLEQVIAQKPGFHAAETEIQRPFDPTESFLPEAAARALAAPELKCYGIEEDVLRFIADRVGPDSRTLETGAGSSTLVFALRGARHTAVSPSEPEIQRIRDYAANRGIDLGTVEFVVKPSESYLPNAALSDLDLVLLDGKHAFPWPMVDWFFTADALKRGGLLLLDDAQVRPVAVVVDFLAADPAWEPVRDFGGKTRVFRKTRDKALDVAWHMQPWTVASFFPPPPTLLRRIRRRLGRVLRGG
jgi:SAM-dependent methyltransferase